MPPKPPTAMIVPDLHRTIDFYRDALGFEVASQAPTADPSGWALLRLGDAILLFHGAAGFLGGIRPGVGARLNLRLVVEDAAAVYEAVCPRAEVVQPLGVDSRGTMEFAVRDCNGFVLTFVQAEHK